MAESNRTYGEIVREFEKLSPSEKEAYREKHYKAAPRSEEQEAAEKMELTPTQKEAVSEVRKEADVWEIRAAFRLHTRATIPEPLNP